LIKVRVRAGDRETRDSIISDLCNRGSAELVTRIGNVALVYRRNDEKPQIPLPL
jgi:RNA-binding protein